MTFEQTRILQITPAVPDWRAIFADESEEGLVIETSLAGWALIERVNGSRAVVGFDATGEVESCEALENFLGYAAPGVTASRWHRDAVRFFHERRSTRAVGEPAAKDAGLALVRRLHGAIQAREWSTVAESYHPTAHYQDPSSELTGRDMIVEHARKLEEPFKDATFEITDALEAQDRVAVCWRYAAVNQGERVLPNGVELPPTGRPVDLSGSSIFRIDEGQIVDERSYWDELSLYRQLGLLTDPGVFGSW